MNLFSNPEILRNARIQLRPRKLLIAAVICAAISLAVGYAFAESPDGLAGKDGNSFLHIILIIQAVVLVIGGGIACLHAIQREKDQNTFDFQRITRLSPLELTLGKLFGAPLMPLFVFLCFLPAAAAGAKAVGTPWTILLAAYVLMVLGAIVYDAFALTISLYLHRGAVTWAILFFLLLVGATAQTGIPGFALGPVSPFVSVSLAQRTTWSLAQDLPRLYMDNAPVSFRDLFFGIPVHHALVLFILYLTVLAWLIPAISRNIKRDPNNYELYTPTQGLGFLCYLNLILIAFCQFNTPRFLFAENKASFKTVGLPPLDVQSALLSINVLLFFIFGFILLRNRNQIRRALHGANPAAIGRLELWPAPYLFLGALIVGLAMILVIQWKRDPLLEWSLAVAIFRVAFFAFWLICDFLFLQWMKLRRAGHSLLVGILYLAVYYFCASIVISALHLTHNPFAAIFLPTPLFVLNTALWNAHESIWFLALALQIAAGIVFVFLQRRRLAELHPHPAALTAASAPSP
ncbi:MAG TPA: hypothetical protein VKS20_02610 [Candidatus Acidoferrales bacterium]|nr:hypothetical protein [Candidatus Acidoferrales bacterium]